MANEYGIDRGNISLTGHSMGGTGTWQIAKIYPELFAKIAPLSDRVHDQSKYIQIFANMPVYTFVGSSDKICPPEESTRLIEEFSKINPSAKIKVFDGA